MISGPALRLGEAALGGAVLALGLFIVVETARLVVAPTYAAIGPKLFPNLVAGGLIVIGALVLREAFFGHIAHERGFELDWGAAALVSAGLVAQMLLIERVGWILGAAILFAAVARAFQSRRPLLDAAIGLALGGLAFVVFNWGLGLSLPTGSLIEPLLTGAGEAPR
jgi:putative tricarboxylic transport membrane protein